MFKVLLAAALSIVGLSPLTIHAQEGKKKSLEERVAELERRVAQLEAREIARWKRARLEMGEIQKALNIYALEHDSEYPDALSEVTVYFVDGVPKDPFAGKNYIYVKGDQGFRLTCLGSDLAKGGREIPERDITFTEEGLVDNPDDAARDEVEQLMGSARDAARVHYAKTGVAPKRITDTGLDIDVFRGDHFKLTDQVYEVGAKGECAALTAEPVAAKDGFAILVFYWVDGTSDVYWYSTLAELKQEHKDVKFDEGAAEDDWRIFYREVGNYHLTKTTSRTESGGKWKDSPTTFSRVEIISVESDLITYKVTQYDADMKETYSASQEVDLTPVDSDTPRLEFTIEEVEVKAGRFRTQKYTSKSGDFEMISWIYKGVTVKAASTSDGFSSTTELQEYKLGRETTPGGGNSDTPDTGKQWDELYKVGANWTVKLDYGTAMWQKTEVVKVENGVATVKYSMKFKETDAWGEAFESSVERPRKVEPGDVPADPKYKELGKGSEKIKDWDCSWMEYEYDGVRYKYWVHAKYGNIVKMVDKDGKVTWEMLELNAK